MRSPTIGYFLRPKVEVGGASKWRIQRELRRTALLANGKPTYSLPHSGDQYLTALRFYTQLRQLPALTSFPFSPSTTHYPIASQAPWS